MNTHMPTQRNGIGNTMARRYTAGALAAVGLIVFAPPPTHAQDQRECLRPSRT